MPAARKPVPLQLIEGSKGKTPGGRDIREAPNFRRIAPEAPEWLPDEALAEWNRVAPGLRRLDLTKEEDRSAFTAYVLCWDRFVTATKTYLEEGILSENSQGRVRHPAVAIAEAASKELRVWANEFGLTPAAESKVARKGDTSGDQDPFE